MKERNRRRVIGLRLAFGIALAIAAHALHAGSASAATPTLARGAADASAGSPIVLAGFTSQQFPAFFKVSSDGRVLQRGGIAIGVSCTSGQTFVVPDAFAGVPIAADGKLHRSIITPPTAGPQGATITGTDTLKARLGPQHSELSGVWRLIVHVSGPGGENASCDSGPVHFMATA